MKQDLQDLNPVNPVNPAILSLVFFAGMFLQREILI